jgi:hypothetical protein
MVVGAAAAGLTTEFTRPQVKGYFKLDLTERNWRTARWHAAGLGVGASLKPEVVRRNFRTSAKSISSAVAHLTDVNALQRLAHGSRYKLRPLEQSRRMGPHMGTTWGQWAPYHPYGRAMWARVVIAHCGREHAIVYMGAQCGRASWEGACHCELLLPQHRNVGAHRGREHATANYCCLNTAMWARIVGGSIVGEQSGRAQCGSPIWTPYGLSWSP